jgi:DNA-binding NtrC family response regulator
MDSSTLLLVEDDRVERRLLLHGLKDQYRVLEAADVDQALERLEHEAVDLVIMDLHLPPDPRTPAGGMRLQAFISETKPRLPVIILTSSSDHEVEQELVRRGVVAFLHKPADPQLILAAVSRAIGKAGRTEA